MQKTHEKKLGMARPLPDKLFYKIGEVSRIADVEPYVLRYWESEFPFLRPRKSKSGQRVYVRKDLECILQIKKLLYDERYTIEGVRKRLSDGHRLLAEPETLPLLDDAPSPPAKVLERVKQQLRDILQKLPN